MLNKKIIECNELPIDIVNDAQYVILQQNPNEYSHSYFKKPSRNFRNKFTRILKI